MSSEIPTNRAAAAALVEPELRALTSAAARMEQIAAKLYGLNRIDLQALEVIGRTEGISPSELARAVGLTTGGMTFVIDRLERAGYAHRSPDVRDRRKVVLHATALTRDRTEKIFGPVGKALAEVADSYGHQELALILGFLRRSRQTMASHADSLAGV